MRKRVAEDVIGWRFLNYTYTRRGDILHAIGRDSAGPKFHTLCGLPQTNKHMRTAKHEPKDVTCLVCVARMEH